MANSEHLRILKQGVATWNKWRRENENIKPDLGGANLDGANLSGANLSGVEFCGAGLVSANLTSANLAGSNLPGARLHGANFSRAILADANFADARVAFATFSDVDLSEAKGLDSIYHFGPCSVGLDTIYKSKGKIPDRFLHGCGVPKELIANIKLPAGPIQPNKLFSVFISHSTKDEAFVRRLHLRMTDANMRVWFAPEDLKGGEKLHEQLFEAIQIHDRLLIVLSEHSIQSEWVMTEIRKARETEKKEKRRRLFPIRLCAMATLQAWECFDADTGKDLAVELREYFIPDFSNWKSHDAFESAFARLKKDLEAENSNK